MLFSRQAFGVALAASMLVACSPTSSAPLTTPGSVDVPPSSAAGAGMLPPVPEQPTTTVTKRSTDFTAELESLPRAADDSSFPDMQPSEASGVYGYSRYVWTDTGRSVVPLLVEGPLGQQVRCQDAALPCSYQELKALSESGTPPPDELGLTAADLDALVDQLDQLNAYIATFESMDDACSAGYSPETEQNPNMGIHMTNPALLADGFDPSMPEMLLWAQPGGEQIPRAELGECADDGTWTGNDDFEIVGAAFLQIIQPDHPDGFVGALDNWHVHYSACSNATSDSIQGERLSCEAAGGTFFERTPVWMMHAYVADHFESQEGTFAMYNSSIWPLGTDSSLDARRNELNANNDGVIDAPIINFAFGDMSISVGDSVAFSNTDSAPHTVTSGRSGEFTGVLDSGLLASGETFTTSFETPGVFSIYCELHPQMTGAITVE